MMIELTRPDGTNILVNTDNVQYIEEREGGGVLIVFSKENDKRNTVMVSETLDSIKDLCAL